MTIQKVFIKRTITPDSPPSALEPGELAVEMAEPTRLWVGVPLTLDPSGKKLLVPSASVAVSEDPPLTPEQGDLWYEADVGILWMYYVDINSSQWVQMNATVIDNGGVDGGGSIDAYTKAESDSRFVNVTGDLMTGNLAIENSAPALTLNNSAALGATITGKKSGSPRWAMWLGDIDAESSGNAGSNFSIDRFDDAGVKLDTAMKISRVGGSTTFHGDVGIQKAGPTNLAIDKTTDGTLVSILGTKNGLGRWQLNLGDAAIESGSNLGSNFSLISFLDDGNSANARPALSVGRASLNAVFYGAVTCNSSIGLAAASNVWNQSGDFQVSLQGWKPGGGSWSASSDSRIKNVLGNYTTGLEAINQLTPVRYRYKGNDSTSAPKSGEPQVSDHHHVLDKEFVGLVAQAAETIMPELVGMKPGFIDGNAVTDLRTLDTTPLLFALLNAVKELKAEVDALKAAR